MLFTWKASTRPALLGMAHHAMAVGGSEHSGSRRAARVAPPAGTAAAVDGRVAPSVHAPKGYGHRGCFWALRT